MFGHPSYRMLGSVSEADDALAPAERLAFVLHDLFAVPFEEIAPMVGRSPIPHARVHNC